LLAPCRQGTVPHFGTVPGLHQRDEQARPYKKISRNFKKTLDSTIAICYIIYTHVLVKFAKNANKS